jgi:hypothetical protein
MTLAECGNLPLFVKRAEKGFHARREDLTAAAGSYARVNTPVLRRASGAPSAEARSSAALPGIGFCGIVGAWANDAKRASAQYNFCFSMT